MPPLTSPLDCSGCLRLSQKISEFEGRISKLYQIREDEQLLDLLAAEASRIPDNNNTMLPWLGPTATTELEPSTVRPIHNDDTWPRLGTKPKARIP